jgi:DNA-directed RNA polymerase specialized sigma24 family protein
VLTPDAFAKLLQWLLDASKKNDSSKPNLQGSLTLSDEDRAGEEYEALREKLTLYFARRGCKVSAEMADETISRVAKRIMEDERIVQSEPIPARFFYNTARYVYLEQIKAQMNAPSAIDELPLSRHPSINPDSLARQETERRERERRIECLEECRLKLRPDNWEMILAYYQGETRRKIENRKSLAERLNLTPNALNIRAHRVRKQLEDCLNSCFSRTKGSIA